MRRYLNKANKFFSGFSLFFQALIILFAILFFALWLKEIFKQVLEKSADDLFVPTINSIKEEPALDFGSAPEPTIIVREEKPASSGESLLASSFTDLFSSFGWLNQSQTDLQYEEMKQAFVLPSSFEKAKEIVSKNINNYSAEVRSAKISEAEFSLDGAKFEFYLSNDGENWIRVNLGEEAVFKNPRGQELRWKGKFYPSNSPEPPVFDSIRLDYQVKFL